MPRPNGYGTLDVVEEIKGTLADIPSITAVVFTQYSIMASVMIPNGVGGEKYLGPYEVVPSTTDNIILETKKKTMTDDVTVFKIPYYETSNESGYTVYIGSEV